MTENVTLPSNWKVKGLFISIVMSAVSSAWDLLIPQSNLPLDAGVLTVILAVYMMLKKSDFWHVWFGLLLFLEFVLILSFDLTFYQYGHSLSIILTYGAAVFALFHAVIVGSELFELQGFPTWYGVGVGVLLPTMVALCRAGMKGELYSYLGSLLGIIMGCIVVLGILWLKEQKGGKDEVH